MEIIWLRTCSIGLYRACKVESCGKVSKSQAVEEQPLDDSTQEPLPDEPFSEVPDVDAALATAKEHGCAPPKQLSNGLPTLNLGEDSLHCWYARVAGNDPCCG